MRNFTRVVLVCEVIWYKFLVESLLGFHLNSSILLYYPIVFFRWIGLNHLWKHVKPSCQSLSNIGARSRNIVWADISSEIFCLIMINLCIWSIVKCFPWVGVETLGWVFNLNDWHNFFYGWKIFNSFLVKRISFCMTRIPEKVSLVSQFLFRYLFSIPCVSTSVLGSNNQAG